jgi:hypothetical protein
LLRVLLPLLARLEPRRASRILASFGVWEMKLSSTRRLVYRNALADLGQRLGCDWDIDEIVPRLAGNLWRWDARDSLLDALDDTGLKQILEVLGEHHLEEALAHRRGVLLLFNHFGPFLIPAHWIVRQGYTLRWFTERPRRISRKVAHTFQSDGPLGQRSMFLTRQMSPAQGGAALRRAIRMLEAGMIVQAAGDVRWHGSRCVEQTFLGHAFTFATNWVILAALSGAPVLPVHAVLLADGSYRIVFGPPELIAKDAADPEHAAYWIRRNLDRVEMCIREHPDNSGEYAFWPPPSVEAVPVERHTVSA